MNVLWISNSPYSPSGYGQQSALIARAMQSLGHSLAFFSNFEPTPRDMPSDFQGSPMFCSPEPDYPSYGLSNAAKDVDADIAILLGEASS